MAKGKKKPTAKKAKAKPVPPKALPKKRLRIWGWAKAMEDLEAEAEQYWRPWADPKLTSKDVRCLMIGPSSYKP